jgi:hypothetical protein
MNAESGDCTRVYKNFDSGTISSNVSFDLNLLETFPFSSQIRCFYFSFSGLCSGRARS